jgi:rhamnosyl/mannosyltransferase
VRILQLGKFYPPHRGGIETHVETLCQGLAQVTTVEVEVIVANDSVWSATENLDGARVRRLGRLVEITSVPLCPRLAWAIRRTPADLIHLHVPNPYAALALLLSGHRAPMVISWHSDVIRQRNLAWLLAPLERAVVNRAAAIVASSANYLESSPTLAWNRARCRVIPFGVDPAEFAVRDPSRVTHIRVCYGPRIVLAAGRLVYYKGFEHLIRAMPQVDAQLLIVGEGPGRAQLESEVARAGVRERVTFLGDVSREQLIDTYHAADVFVLPSIARSEAFGIVQLEAMACGVPIVNTRIESGAPGVSLDDETGLTVEPGLPAALAAAINRLLDDPELRARYGAAGARRVREHFSRDMMVTRTLALYREVLGRLQKPVQ